MPKLNEYKINPKRFLFKIYTTYELNESELVVLSEIMKAMPHCYVEASESYERFAAFDPAPYPKKLLLLAVNAFDNYGNTVLGIACEYGKDISVIQRLIDMGADVNEPGRGEMTKLALHWAICNQLSFHNSNTKNNFKFVAAVRCLLNNGANPRMRCYQDMTVLDYAERRGYVAAAKLIKVHQSGYFEGALFGLLNAPRQHTSGLTPATVPLSRDNCRAILEFLNTEEIKPVLATCKSSWMEAKKLSFISNEIFSSLIGKQPQDNTEGYLRWRMEGQENLPHDDQFTNTEQTASAFIEKQQRIHLGNFLENRSQGFFFKHAEDNQKILPPGLQLQIIPSYSCCLFKAVAAYLGLPAQALRDGLADKLLSENGRSYLTVGRNTSECNSSIESYAEKVRKYWWSDSVTKKVLMKLLQQPIIIISETDNALNADKEDQYREGTPIFVFRNNNHHYDSFKLTGTHTPEEIRSLILTRKRNFSTLSEENQLRTKLK